MPRHFARFMHRGRPCWGLKEGAQLKVLNTAPWVGESLSGESLEFAHVELLAPAEPTKIICVGLNYRDHAEEMRMESPEEPLIFMKPPSALLDPGKSIRLPRASHRVDYEAELAFVVGKRIGPGHDDEDAIFGYTCANDVTARDLQKKDGQWTRSKGFDTFCPLGPTLVQGLNVASLSVECKVNGQVRQSSGTENLIFRPQQIINFIAEIMTLNPGDLVLTGTPAGIGELKAGDEVEVHIDQIGSLYNLVVH
jgi:2-keto-4-pentenoate hydratase/2-oxohepta-3-ene-1,7-dioic acid hydratase in catechol pathway